MPELPEVETVARGLSRRLTGRVIEWVRLYRADIVHGTPLPLGDTLCGRRIKNVRRVGKQVRMDTDGPVSVLVHLGMTGRLTAVDRDEPIEPHTHLRTGFRRRRIELRFCDPRRFGGIWLVDGKERQSDNWIGRRLPPIGADPLRLSLTELRPLLRRRRQIKALLLDQQPISGIGNIYCDEALYRAGIHPLTRANELDDNSVRQLRLALRRVLNEAIRAGGSSISDYRTADDVPGTFQRRHRVYGRADKPCRRCGTPILRLTVAGRGTHICPACQPGPTGKTGQKRTRRL